MTMMAQINYSNDLSLQYLLQGIAKTEFAHQIGGVNLDSRLVKAGDLFLACQGEKDHGERYIKDAISAGAIAVVVEAESLSQLDIDSCSVPLIPVKDLRFQAGKIIERFYHSPSRDLRVVGITGTNGKTSVAYILAQALSAYQEKKLALLVL